MFNKNIFYIAWKLLFTRKALFGGSTPLSLLGLILGVACLFVSMAVMSGFESTLKKTMADVTGHIQIIERPKSNPNWKEFEEQIMKLEPQIKVTTRFLYLEAVLANEGQISGVLVQGIDKDKYNEVLNLNSRVVSGENSLLSKDKMPSALIGKGIAKRMNFKVGDVFKVVVPISDSFNPGVFKRQIGEFKISGILDLGKHEWNERSIIIDIHEAQKVALIGNRYTGLLLKTHDLDKARQTSYNLAQKLGPEFWIRDWKDVNENLFDAVVIERIVIFLVVLIIVVVAAFNISSTLYVGVIQRNNDIAILKTLGVSKRQILHIFTLQGLFLGSFGFVLGNLLGLILCQLFMWGQQVFELIPGSVYKIDNIIVEVRWLDLSAIGVATLIICYIATLAPALRSSRLTVVEGLR
jgi:lipoprotein-releasing system permease protein